MIKKAELQCGSAFCLYACFLDTVGYFRLLPLADFLTALVYFFARTAGFCSGFIRSFAAIAAPIMPASFSS